ncbi:hypothetical protein QMZ92_10830 [Streptomyces sp. HNM0645]|uniref:hypothetical protein n=1 Tax=Streptomyces sp. HNM0645 TaxID=2782343 RepID=UPI0024B73400|nr:hypothetical protein [Streptomyces sp. HNM0645]MDI9884874.1 hypothetical protein [Streptomyces sp. HNM0645]
MNQRLTGLALAVVCAALLPLAASAAPGGADATANGKRVGRSASVAGMYAPRGPRQASEVVHGAAGARRTSEHCGPEVISPHGIEAQTCVLADGPDAWARTYYRNVTGGGIMPVLTLMGPGGRTVRAHCAAEPGDEPAVCETPREKARGEADGYYAIAEFARSGEAGDGPLLLRAGSNSPVSGSS